MLSKFNDPLIKLLLIAAVVALVVGFVEKSYMEGLGILLAIILATVIAFFNEFKAGKEFDILNKVNDQMMVKVVRNGQATEIPKMDVVVGDVVLLEQGDEVPADGKLLEAFTLHINESTLNGESMPAAKVAEVVQCYETTYAPNIVLRGTVVTDGQGVAEITAVGDNTEIGATAREATTINEEKTPLNKQLTRLSSVIGKVGLAMAVAIFVLLLLHSWLVEHEISFPVDTDSIARILTCFMMAIALMVAVVPEGLPMSVTLSLAYSMRRMTRTNNLVRRMHATETMGAATVICTDKTGTLTQNKMRVYAHHFTTDDALVTESVALNSTAHLDLTNAAEVKPVGNPTEGALLLWLHDRGISYDAERRKTAVTDRLLFATEHKFMATRCVSPSTGEELIYVKGAPEVVMKRCASVPDDVHDLLSGYQQRGMRTLAFACKKAEASDKGELINLSQQLTFMGFVAIADPVRSDVGEAIQQCMDAGIEVKIVTGDTSATAVEIARQIGLWQPADTPEQQITGSDFAALSDEQALEAAGRIKIMSRARPTDKLRLVKLLQHRGEVVAVTGDGTNDAPALNHADVGLAMGSGTSVAKEAGDIILLDDSFNSIVNAVRWGRSLYRNIQRFIQFQLTINVIALVVVFVGPFLGIDFPLTVTQMLWVNLIMDTFAALALATEPPDNSVMKDKPRKVSDFIITRTMATHIFTYAAAFLMLLVGLLFWVVRGEIHAYDLSVFFTVFVLLQFWNLFNARCSGSCRSALRGLWENKVFVMIAVIILALQVVIVQFGGAVFRTVPLSLRDWLIIIAGTSVVLWAGEITRAIGRAKGEKVKGEKVKGEG